MPNWYYDCAACAGSPPQGFNRDPTSATQCCHCHLWNRTWTKVDALENQLWMQKRSFVTSVLAGTWTSPVGNAIPAAALTQANLYGGKHFDLDKDKDAGKYRPADRFLVKAMEEHAIAHGLAVPGAYIFKFNAAVGSDGSTFADFTANSSAIRVDSVGALQHSHPIPEERCAAVNHKALVCGRIVAAANSGNLHDLLRVAVYLTTIGAAENAYKLNANERRLITAGKVLREGKFW